MGNDRLPKAVYSLRSLLNEFPIKTLLRHASNVVQLFSDGKYGNALSG